MVKSMTEGSPIKHILLFAVPLFIGNIFQQIYNFADAAIVGRFVNANALAAVGASGSMLGLLVSLIMGLTNGASIIIAQVFGRGVYKDLRRAAGSLYLVSFILSFVIGAVGFCLSTPILRLLNTPDNILKDASMYMKILFCGVPAMAIYNAGSALLRSLGNARTPLYMLIISSIVNVALDLLFIVVFKQGVAGAAYATVASQIICAVMCSVYIYAKRKSMYLEGMTFRADKMMITKIFQMGVPTALQSALICLGGMSVQSLVNSFGEMTMAAYTASNKIDSIALQCLVSIATSLSVFTGQNIGAGKLDRIRECLKKVLVLQVCMCSALAVIIVILRKQLLGMFLDESASEAVLIGSKYISIIAVAYVSAGIMQSFLSVIRGAGDVNFSVVAGLVELAVRIVFAYLLANIMHSSTGVWIATPIAWVTACILTVLRYKSGKWKKGI